MPDQVTDQPAATHVSRLTPLDRYDELLPWRRAKRFTRCFLAWMPISAFPSRDSEVQWLLRFTSLLCDRLKTDFKLEPHVFLEFKTAFKFKEQILRHSRAFLPLAGLGRHPGAQIPAPPEESKEISDGKRRAEDYMADYCYWFLARSTARQCELFQGSGGLSILYWKADPKARPPEFSLPASIRNHESFRQVDVMGMLAAACSMRDPFLARSKEIVGAGLKDALQAESVPFMIPLLNSAEIFALSEQELNAYFELFDVYLRESPADKGMVLASKHDLEEILIALMKEMRDFKPEPSLAP